MRRTTTYYLSKQNNGLNYHIEFYSYSHGISHDETLAISLTLASALNVILDHSQEKLVEVKYLRSLVKEDSLLAKSRILRAERELTDLVVREHNKAIKLQTKLKRIREII